MDESRRADGVTFVWDADKARSNLSQHGVSFEQAAEAFFDPFLTVVDAAPDDEARDAVIGMDERWHLLVVAHVAAGEDRIRLVSARRAVGHERWTYES